jgi:hypothetical protein
MQRLLATCLIAVFTSGASEPRTHFKLPIAVEVRGTTDSVATYRAYATGGILTTYTMAESGPRIELVPEGDTTRGKSPVHFRVDVTRGTITFEATGKSDIRAVAYLAWLDRNQRPQRAEAIGRVLVLKANGTFAKFEKVK